MVYLESRHVQAAKKNCYFCIYPFMDTGMKIQKFYRVAGLVPTTFEYGRQVMSGGLERLATEPDIEVMWFQQEFPPPERMARWQVEGVIGMFSDGNPSGPWTDLGVPVVNASSSLQALPVVNVSTNHERIGRMAAEHLQEKGLKSFAYLGLENRRFSDRRQEGFFRALNGLQPHTLILPSKMWDWFDLILEWAAALPKPTGVFCAGDNEARVFLSVCRSHSIKVPEELVVIGGNNDEDVCLSCIPQLTSVPARAREVGWRAMDVLVSRLHEPDAPVADRVVEPASPIPRESTNILFGVQDPEIEKLLQFIRENIQNRIGVEELAVRYKGSRRTLETRFRRELGRTPLEEIHRVRLETVKRLLSDTNLALSEVARLSGIVNINHLCVFFRRQTGISPGAYRELCAER